MLIVFFKVYMMLLDGLIYKNASYFLEWKHDIFEKSQSDK